jgi:hypothetical protein
VDSFEGRRPQSLPRRHNDVLVLHNPRGGRRKGLYEAPERGERGRKRAEKSARVTEWGGGGHALENSRGEFGKKGRKEESGKGD